MFEKISILHKYLYDNLFIKEAEYLYKIALLNAEEYKEKYPIIYEASQKTNDKPWMAYAYQLKNMEDKGLDIVEEEISSFQDIVDILRKTKDESKKEFKDEVLEFLKENLYEDEYFPSESDIKLAKSANLSKEEIFFIARDLTNHTWEEKVDMADKFNKTRASAFSDNDKHLSVFDFGSIDDARDFMQSILNPSPKGLESFYEEIKGEALANSSVIYNSKRYIVSHSRTMEAAQYWEQSCVTVDEKGNRRSGLCSAHPNKGSNYFYAYDKDIHSFQIITKEYDTLKETPRTSFSKYNKEYNLISLSIHKETGRVKWGGQDTVNRLNRPVNSSDLVFVLKEEYDSIVDAIKKYCKSELDLEIDTTGKYQGSFLLKEQCVSKIEKGKAGAAFFVTEFDKNYPEFIVKNLNNILPILYFELKLDEKYDDSNPEFAKIIKDKIEEWGLTKIIRGNYPAKGISEKLDNYIMKYFDYVTVHIAANHLTDKAYFIANLDKRFEGYLDPDILKYKLEFVNNYDYFDLNLDEKHPDLLKDKLESLKPRHYFDFNLDEKYPVLANYDVLKNKLNEISAREYFQNSKQTTIQNYTEERIELDEKYGKKYPDILESKLNEIKTSEYFIFELNEKYEDSFPDILSKKIKDMDVIDYMRFQFYEKYKEAANYKLNIENMEKEKIKELAEYVFWSKKEDIVENINPETFKKLLITLDEKFIFEYNILSTYKNKYEKTFEKRYSECDSQTYFEYSIYQYYPDLICKKLNNLRKKYKNNDEFFKYLDIYGFRYADVFPEGSKNKEAYNKKCVKDFMEEVFKNMTDKEYFKWGPTLVGMDYKKDDHSDSQPLDLFFETDFHHTKKRLEKLEPKNYYLYRLFFHNKFNEYFDDEFKEKGKKQISPEEYFEDFHFIDLKDDFPELHSGKLKEYKEKYGKEPDVLNEDF